MERQAAEGYLIGSRGEHPAAEVAPAERSAEHVTEQQVRRVAERQEVDVFTQLVYQLRRQRERPDSSRCLWFVELEPAVVLHQRSHHCDPAGVEIDVLEPKGSRLTEAQPSPMTPPRKIRHRHSGPIASAR